MTFKHNHIHEAPVENPPFVVGPFTQVLTMANMPAEGPIHDEELEIFIDVGIKIHKGIIQEINPFDQIRATVDAVYEIPFSAVVMPGFIDAHTHLCWAGSRAAEYTQRISGSSYQEIAQAGGGIAATAKMTHRASKNELIQLMLQRTKRLLDSGVTTCEVKSGYGETIDDELKSLQAVWETVSRQPVDLIPTCLAAHAGSKDLKEISAQLFPILFDTLLARRIDIFVDEGGFSVDEARVYLNEAKNYEFTLTLHADQFSVGGSRLAAEVGAISADHLECSTEKELIILKEGNVIPIVLPGSSLGLGEPYAPARKILDTGLPLVIASDWNPGSAPMGELLLQAAVLSAAEHLSAAETLAAVTCRAARALALEDRGTLVSGQRADMIIFPCGDYREILYQQGTLKPTTVFIKGQCVKEGARA